MQSISFYLHRFSSLEPADMVVRRAVREVVLRITGISIDDVAITVAGRMVYVSAHPLLKSELYIRHEEVSRELNDLLAGRRLTHIQ